MLGEGAQVRVVPEEWLGTGPAFCRRLLLDLTGNIESLGSNPSGCGARQSAHGRTSAPTQDLYHGRRGCAVTSRPCHFRPPRATGRHAQRGCAGFCARAHALERSVTCATLGAMVPRPAGARDPMDMM